MRRDYDEETEERCTECGKPLNAYDDSLCNDCLMGLAGRVQEEPQEEELEEWEYDLLNALDDNDLYVPMSALEGFPSEPCYCERCKGVIIEADYVYTQRLDYCYFCLDAIWHEEEALNANKNDEGETVFVFGETDGTDVQARDDRNL